MIDFALTEWKAKVFNAGKSSAWANLETCVVEQVLAYEHLLLASLQSLADALAVKGAYTWGHCTRVCGYAMKIASELSLVPHAVAVVRSHHERFDGRGAPGALCGDGIPIKARVAAVADSFTAITSGRSYRAGMSVDYALTELALACSLIRRVCNCRIPHCS